MKGKVVKRVLCLVLSAGMLLSCFGCGKREPVNLMDRMERDNTKGKAGGNGKDGSAGEKDGEGGFLGSDDFRGSGNPLDDASAVTDFGIRLFRQSMEEEDGNILISPLSVLTALAMTANGAKGETLAQMEQVFGMTVQELTAYLCVYREALPEAEKYKLSMANSIWFTEDERFTVEQGFLQTNEEYFNAGLYQAPFDDSTVREINRWVKENTDGMIDEILDEIPQDAVMYLINALAFDAEWRNTYEKGDVRNGDFTMEDGTVQKVEMMHSSEHLFLEDDGAEGFLKYYSDRKYAFAALLPAEGATVSEYVSGLTGERLREILTNPVDVKVMAAIPKFKNECAISMKDILCRMGMTEAFSSSRADLTGIGVSENGNLYISRVLHKTFIEVNELGTKAGAVTAVEIKNECAAVEDPEPVKTVYLDRPFVYMIIDCENCLPVFIGTVMEIGE